MIELYYWPTPNGWKISIMLFECGLPFKAQGIAIANHPNVQRWFPKLRERPGVNAGMDLLAELRRGAPPPDATTRELLFGNRPAAGKPA